jgi:hypothetical protein
MWVASCLLSTAIRGGGTVLQQIRSVHQLFSALSSHWSSSLSHGWPHASSPPPSEAILSSYWSSSLSRGLPRASSPPPSEAGEPYYSRSGQYISCLPRSFLIDLAACHVGGLAPPLHRHQRPYSLLIGLAVCHVVCLVPPLHCHQRWGNSTTANQVSTSIVYHSLFSLV